MKKIKGYNDYYIDESGKVYDKSGNEVKIHITHNRETVNLRKGNKYYQVKLFLIYYEAFGKSIYETLPSKEGEYWVDVYNHPDYAVSNLGRIKSKITETEKPLSSNGKGYMRVCFGHKYDYVHRVVLESFIRPFEDYEEADHINTIRNDNRLENLRICTKSQNMGNSLTRQHIETNNSFGKKQIIECDLNDNEIKVWESVKAAAVFYNVGSTAICNCLKGLNETSCNRKWKYVTS